MKSLFLPLKKQYYEKFEQGLKTTEYRPYGPRWNEHTCVIGREVIISCGYGKTRRLHGVIISFEVRTISESNGGAAFRQVYRQNAKGPIAEIGIELNKEDNQSCGSAHQILPGLNGDSIINKSLK